jgi:superfamily II DNA or RNA helicase
MITLNILDPVHVETNKEGKVNLNVCLSYEAVTWTRPKNKNKKKRRIDYLTYLIQPALDHKWIFPTGLLPRAIDFLDEHNLPYQVSGTLGKVEYNKPGVKGLTFRPDQKRLIRAALVNGRGVLQSPCASGKTILLIGIISAFKQEQILFLCHKTTLITQFKEELLKWGFRSEEIGIISGKENTTGRVQLASIQSFSNLDPRTYVGKYDVILIDEVHSVSSYKGQYAKVLQRSLAPVRIGVTATMPYKEDAKFALEGLIGPKLEEVTVKEASELGIIAKPKIRILDAPHVDGLEYVEGAKDNLKYPEVYHLGIVDNLARNMVIVMTAKKKASEGQSVLINIVSIAHGARLEALGREWGMPCTFIHGADKDDVRSRIKAALESKKIKVVIASAIWKEGVNIRSLNVVINAAGGLSEIAALQALGRGLRITKTKKTVLIIDFKDGSHKYLRKHSRERKKIYEKNGWL